MAYQIVTPEQSLDIEYRKENVSTQDYQLFIIQLYKLLEGIDTGLGNDDPIEYYYSILRDFVETTFLFRTTKQNDALICKGKNSAKECWISLVHPAERAEMINRRNIQKYAFYTLVRDYLLAEKKDHIQRFLITNIYEWYFFNLEEISQLVAWVHRTGINFHGIRDLNKGEGLIFSREIDSILSSYKPIEELIHFNLYGISSLLNQGSPDGEQKLLPIYKLLAPQGMIGIRRNSEVRKSHNYLYEKLKQFFKRNKASPFQQNEPLGANLIPKKYINWSEWAFWMFVQTYVLKFYEAKISSFYLTKNQDPYIPIDDSVNALALFSNLEAYKNWCLRYTNKAYPLSSKDKTLKLPKLPFLKQILDEFESFSCISSQKNIEDLQAIFQNIEFVEEGKASISKEVKPSIDFQDGIKLLEQLMDFEIPSTSLQAICSLMVKELAASYLKTQNNDIDKLYQASLLVDSNELKRTVKSWRIMDPWLNDGRWVVYVSNALIELGIALGIYGKKWQQYYFQREISCEQNKWTVEHEDEKRVFSNIIFKAKREIFKKQIFAVGTDIFSILATQLISCLDMFQYWDWNQANNQYQLPSNEIENHLKRGIGLLTLVGIKNYEVENPSKHFNLIFSQLEKEKKESLSQHSNHQKNLFAKENKIKDETPIDIIYDVSKSPKLQTLDYSRNYLPKKDLKSKLIPKESLLGQKEELKEKDFIYDWWNEFTDKKGFDLIISCPPVISQVNLVDIKPFIKQHFRLHQYQAYSYFYVVELSYRLMRDNALGAFVIPKGFQTANYASTFRKWTEKRKMKIGEEYTKLNEGLGKNALLALSKDQIHSPNKESSLFLT